MFTGLVQTTGAIRERHEGREGRRLVIEAELREGDRAVGASVCVSGVCLTVTQTNPRCFAADAAFETLALTTLGGLKLGDRVNLEPSLRLGDALGGHLVSGHVDGVAELRECTRRGDAWECWFRVPEALCRFIAVKGSVAIDGVSLTVNRVDAEGFMVGLIPHTLAETTLGALVEARAAGQPAPSLNLEVDTLARYVERLLQFPPRSDGEPGSVANAPGDPT